MLVNQGLGGLHVPVLPQSRVPVSILCLAQREEARQRTLAFACLAGRDEGESKSRQKWPYMSWLGADLPKYSTTIVSNLQSLYIIVLTEQSNILVTQPGF